MKRKRSLLVEVLLFFMVGIILITILAGWILKRVADSNVTRSVESQTAGVTADVELTITEYDSYEWVLDYLIRHRDDDLDLEYECSDQTRIKESELAVRHPGLVLEDIEAEELETFSEEDQKAFAEIIFNRWLMRMNELKKIYAAKFLFFFAAEDDFEETIFLVTASDGTRKRGTGPQDAYLLGKTVPNVEAEITAFKAVKTGDDRIIYSPENVDRYCYLFRVGDMNILSGMSIPIPEVTQEVERQSLQSVGYFLLLEIGLVIFCLIHIYIYALRPLAKVRQNVKEYAAAKDGEKVREQLAQLHSRNEIGELAVGIADMTREIDFHVEEIKTITSEKERISAELNVAKKIQADMLPNTFPPFPDIKEFDIFANMDPAKEVGGDFYDFFLVDKDHVALVIADVSGKGVPAALFMVISKTLIKDRALMGDGPAQVLYDVNNQLCVGNTLEYFVTVWLAIVDIRTGKGLAANAGHEHPVLRRAGGSYELVKYSHSPAVGVLEDIPFEEHEFVLFPGDRIFVYTDGVPEATNMENELFGTDRMMESLNEKPEIGEAELVAKVKADIDTFVGGAEQFDDITMLVFDYYGDGSR